VARSPKVFLSSVFDPGFHEPVRAACAGIIWDPREVRRDNPQRTIEDICRDLIRKSDIFIGIFDERGGSEPFEEGIKPVTVLEIELLQALFQRMPIYLFTMPGFERNHRLAGLVSLARKYGLAKIIACPAIEFRVIDKDHKQLTESGVTLIAGVVRDRLFQRMRRYSSVAATHLTPTRSLDISILADEFDSFSDPFDPHHTALHLATAERQTDHAARLSYLWPALRQLSSVPYTNEELSGHWPLWERLAGAWDNSAAWYGLHDASPIGRLAATNTIIWIRERSGATVQRAALSRGARASAFYSMGKRVWLPWHRRRLFRYALNEIDAALAAPLASPANYLAIRGSVQLRLWHVSAAIADYEEVVADRSRLLDTHSAQGEAWVELGWAYLQALRFRKAKQALQRGVDLMRDYWKRNPKARTEFLSRALLKYAIAFAIMLDFRKARAAAAEGCKLAREKITADQLRGLRGLICRMISGGT